MVADKDSMIGKVAYIYYKGGAKGDSTLVDDHSSGEPFPVVLGANRIPVGLENAILDMKVGESRTVTIPSELGYSKYLEEEAQWFPRLKIDHGKDLHTGSFLIWTDPECSAKRAVRVTDETEDYIKIDFNHPFAGKDLEYWVELVDLK